MNVCNPSVSLFLTLYRALKHIASCSQHGRSTRSASYLQHNPTWLCWSLLRTWRCPIWRGWCRFQLFSLLLLALLITWCLFFLWSTFFLFCSYSPILTVRVGCTFVRGTIHWAWAHTGSMRSRRREIATERQVPITQRVRVNKSQQTQKPWESL